MDLKIKLKQFEPKKTYTRLGAKCYLDTFRQMLVPATPESLLLYKMEMYVHHVMGVPKNRMYIHQSLRKYGLDSTKVLDIVIHDVVAGELKPVAIVECKTPGNSLYFTTIAHIEEFAKTFNVNYLIVTNGDDVDSYISREDRNSFWKIDNVPNYETICNSHREMLEQEAAAKALAVKPAATSAAEKHPKKKEERPKPVLKFNSQLTPKEFQPVIMSLLNTLKDTTSKVKSQTLGGIRMVGDCGKRKKNTGYGSEKHPNTVLRTFLIKDFYDNHQLMSLDINPNQAGAPILSVTLDNYDNKQVIFEMDLNVCLKKNDQKVNLFYNFQKAFEAEGPDFIAGLTQLVTEKCPEILRPNTLEFGQMNLTEPVTLAQEDASKALIHVMAFALLLDEYRETIKRKPRLPKKKQK